MFRYKATIALISISCWLPASPARAADRVEQFFGIWVDKAQSPFQCSAAEGEGPWYTIGPKLFIQPAADPCEEVEMFVKDGKLRISASCSGDEEGFTAVTAEFELRANGELIHNGEPYVKCTGPLPKWYSGAKK